jgi:hypothetical protein
MIRERTGGHANEAELRSYQRKLDEIAIGSHAGPAMAK